MAAMTKTYRDALRLAKSLPQPEKERLFIYLKNEIELYKISLTDARIEEALKEYERGEARVMTPDEICEEARI